MKPIKIHNEGRVKKQMTRKAELLGQTPPKYTEKSSVINTVRRWEKKFGYDYDCPEYELSERLRKERDEFHDKAMKYCGGSTFSKKQTRFDKMRMKEELGFKLNEIPIKKFFRRIDIKLNTILKEEAFANIMKAR